MIKLIQERNPELGFIEQVLYNRGINTTVEDFFNLTWDCVNDPFNLEHMSEAIEMYNRHIMANSKIAVLVDADMDGFSSAALLMNYTALQKSIGDEWKDSTSELIPIFHAEKSHGLGDKTVMRSIRDKIKPQLLVVPDASGTAEQYQALNEIGVDVLVLDHHDTFETGDGARTIVVNNRHSPKYTNKEFSGVGVVWQFCRALDKKLTLCCADNFLDLVAIGNIGDLMSLASDETRFICQCGLSEDSI